VSTARWSDADLGAWRQYGDPPADEAVSRVLASGDVKAVQGLMNTLVLNDAPAPSDLPPELAEYLEETGRIDPASLPAPEKGEQLFAEFGPEMLMLLGCYSLPLTYGARKGVHVLYRTGYLLRRPNRRVFETMQMIVDVLSPGGLDPAGKGIRAAQKVRLMHAAVRTLILQDRTNPWDTAQLGIPINQEDLAGTLMSFSWLVLDGLNKLGIHVSEDEQQVYLDTWIAVGRIMGVRPELLPADVQEAGELTHLILGQQVDPCEESRLLTQALLEMLGESTPPGFKEFPAGLMRHFLDHDVAEGLGIPQCRLAEHLAVAESHMQGRVGQILGGSCLGRPLRHFNVALLQWLINVDRGGRRAQFAIPDDLHKYWHQPLVEEEGFGERLFKWIKA